jgi:hypothetical protein
MAKCHVCDKETEDRFLFNRFSFGAHVGDKRLQLKAQWVDGKDRDIAVCHRCSANLLESFGKGLTESLSGKSKLIT